MPEAPATIDDYIAAQPEEVRPVLEEIRRRAHAAAPGAEETVRHAMPTLVLDGTALVHFAGWRRHVGVYPTAAPSDDEDFETRFSPYRAEQGTAAFPLSEPVPFDLVQRQVELLVAQRRATENSTGGA